MSSTRAVWSDFGKKRFFLYRSEGDTDPLELGPGDTITWEGRPDYSKIAHVAGHGNSVGPMGFSYLPYREEGRWARGAFSLRGDARFVICYPTGTPHYGLHIPLHTIQKDEVPLYTGPPGEITVTSEDALVELRHKLVSAGKKANLACTVYESTYSFSTDTTHFRACISRSPTGPRYRVDVYLVVGHLSLMKTYSDLL
jgi:hypothetical protein